MSIPVLATKEKCTGCQACVDSCNNGSLNSYIADDGHVYITINEESCINCGRCTKVCPVVNGYSYEAPERNSQPWAAWANDDELRMKSASGGIFAALAVKIISDGGCAVGAVMDGFEVKHIIVDKIEDLKKIQGSKYQQGSLTGIYREVRSRLKKGQKVLFSGTGCQIAGIYNFIGDKYNDLLITADIICGGFPSILPMHVFIKNLEKQALSIKTFRDKTTGWRSLGYAYTLKTNNYDGSETNYGNKNIVLGAFSSHLTNRKNCLDCQFSGLKRKSDLTMADFWGDVDYPEQHYKGLSVVIIHSVLGQNLLENSDITLQKTSWRKFLPNNPRMINGNFSILNLHPVRIFYPWIFKHCSYKTIENVFYADNTSIFWKLYKLIFLGLYFLYRLKTKKLIMKFIENNK